MHSEKPAIVHVVDDDASFCASVTRMLQIAGLSSIGHGSVGEFLLSYSSDTPSCIVLDIAMPGPSGIDLLNVFASRKAAPPIIFLTGRDDVMTTVDVMKNGAVDYIVKPVSASRLIPSVHRALRRDIERRATLRKAHELNVRFAQLTQSERVIFCGILRSRLNKQLAADLGTCERTVKAQRARMMAKLGIETLPDLVRAASLLEVTASDELMRTPSQAQRSSNMSASADA